MRIPPFPEPLEPRIAPAGLVGAFFDPVTKSLTLTGDALANDVTVTETKPGVLVVLAGGGTQLEPRDFFGVPLAPASADPLTFGGFAGDLTLDLGAGADRASVLHLTKVRNLTLQPGADSDNVFLSNVAVGGTLTGTDPSGNNTLAIDHLSVKKGFDWTGGSNDDAYSFGAGPLTVGGNFSIGDSGGDNVVGNQAGDVKIGGELTYFGSGAGGDTVVFNNVSLQAKRVFIHTFDGNSSVSLTAAESWKIAGDLKLQNNNHAVTASYALQIPVLTVGAGFSLGSGAGTTVVNLIAAKVAVKGAMSISLVGLAGTSSGATLSLGNATLGGLSLSSVDGVNVTSIAATGKLTTAGFSYSSGSEGDSLTISAGLLAVKNSFLVDTGAARDFVTINGAITAGSVQVDLRAGDDSFAWNSRPFRGAKSQIKGNFVATLGDGMDAFTLTALARAATTVGGDFLINADDALASGESITVEGLKAMKTLGINSNSKFNATLRNVTVGGSTVLDALDALTATIAGSSFLGTVLINGGTNADFIVIADVLSSANPAVTTFAKAVTISLFAGADQLTIGATPLLGRPIFKSTVTIDGGADAAADSVTIGTNAVFLGGAATLTNFP